MSDRMKKELSININTNVDTAPIKSAEKILNNFFDEYKNRSLELGIDKKALKIDTKDFYKAIAAASQLENSIDGVRRSAPAMVKALNADIEFASNVRGELEEAMAVFNDGSIARGFNEITSKLSDGLSMVAVDLGGRVSYIKEQISDVLYELKSLSSVSLGNERTYGSMDRWDIEQRIELIGKLIDAQKELQGFSTIELDSNDFESGYNIKGLERLKRHLQQTASNLEEFNLKTTEQLRRREELINRVYEGEWYNHDWAKENIKDNGIYQDSIDKLQSFIDKRRNLIRELQNNEDELFSSDGIRTYVSDLNSVIEGYENNIKELQNLKYPKDNTFLTGNTSEIVEALKEIKNVINEIKTAFDPLTEALKTGGNAFSAMTKEGSTSLDTLLGKLEELATLMDIVSKKDFTTSIQQVFNTKQTQSMTNAAQFSVLKEKAEALLDIIRELDKAQTEFSNSNSKMYAKTMSQLGTEEMMSFFRQLEKMRDPGLAGKISGSETTKDIKTIIGNLEAYKDTLLNVVNIINSLVPNAIDTSLLSDLADIDRKLSQVKNIGAGVPKQQKPITEDGAKINEENIISQVRELSERVETEFKTIRGAIEATFDLSTIDMKRDAFSAILDSIYNQFVELRNKIKALDFSIDVPDNVKFINANKTTAQSGDNTEGSVNAAADAISREGKAAAEAAISKEKFVEANKAAAQSAENTAPAAKKAADGIQEEAAASKVAAEAVENLANAQKKIKTPGKAAVLGGLSQADFEDYAAQIAANQGMKLDNVSVTLGQNDNMRLATVKMINEELAQSVTYTYQLIQLEDDLTEAYLTSATHVGNINKAQKQAIAQQKKADKERFRNTKWLIQQQAALDKQDTKYKYSSKPIDGSTKLMSAETSLSNEIEHTIDNLAAHIRTRLKEAISSRTLTDEVKSEILNDLRILQNEIAVQQNMKYSATSMKASTVQTNKKAYEQFLNAFESRAKKANVFSAMEQDLASLRAELDKVTDSSQLDKFVENLKVARNKLQAEIAKSSQETNETKRIEQEYNRLISLQDKLYNLKKKQVGVDESSADGKEIQRRINEAQQEYDAYVNLISVAENYYKIKERERTLGGELRTLQEEYDWNRRNAEIKQEELEIERQTTEQKRIYNSLLDEEENRKKSEDAQKQKELNNLYSQRKQIISELLEYTKQLNKATDEASKKAAQQAVDSATGRLAAKNAEIFGYGSLVDLAKLNSQDEVLTEGLRKFNWSNYIKEQANESKDAYENVLRVQKEFYQASMDFERNKGEGLESNRLLDKTIQLEKEYNDAKTNTKLTQEQKNALIKEELRYQEQLTSIQNKNKDKENENAQKAQFKEISDLYSKYLNERASYHKMSIAPNAKDLVPQLNASNDAIDEMRNKLLSLGVNLNNINQSSMLTQEQKNELLRKEAKHRERIIKQYAEMQAAENKAATKEQERINKQNQNYGKSRFNTETRNYDKIMASYRAMETDSGVSAKFQKQIDEYEEAYRNLERLRKQFADDPTAATNPKLTQEFQDAALKAEQLRKGILGIIKEADKLDSIPMDRILRTSDITTAENTKEAMEKLANEVSNGTFKLTGFNAAGTEMYGTMKTANGAIEEITIALKAGTNQLVAFKKEGGNVTSVFKNFASSAVGQVKRLAVMYLSFYDIVRYLRRGIQTVREIDLAMTELKKVTDETEQSYAKFLETASKSAGEIGSTVTDFTQVTSDFARLGYSIEEASELAKTALVYENVGDGFSSVEEASESIISTMMAFGMEAEDTMGIVDRFNAVGNNFAITSKGIGDALQRSASALVEGGNTIDEAIGLVTAANSVIQNPEQVGTALKTLSLRIRGAKVELEEAGEDVDGMAESTAQLQEKLLALTGGKVDIMLDENTFKNTTQILREMSAVWEDMTDINQAAALELLGGKILPQCTVMCI